MAKNWHIKSLSEIFEEFHTSEHGLGSKESVHLLGEYGPNKLPEAKADGLAIIFLRQFQSPLIYILIAAAVIVFLIGGIIDSIIIFAVLFFNAIVGTVQEGKAQNTLSALKKFVETKTSVIRDGKEVIIKDVEVVPGDIIILQEGGKVPADARVFLSRNIKIDESTLTGESSPVHKVSDILEKEDLPISEQKNMVFKGTSVVSGNGKAVVAATGRDTVIGKIAKEIADIDTEIPLKANIRYLSRLIIIAVSFVAVLFFIFGIFDGRPAKEIFTTIVALSVSIIPEGLYIVMTLILASGVWRMSKRNVLVKKLQAVEALGQARIIAVDKTGTITKNEMIVQKVYVDDKFFDIGGAGYEPKGEIKLNGINIDSANHPELLFTGKIAAFCASARVMFSEESKQWRVIGDPTEAAMLVLSQKLGFHKDDLEKESPLLAEIPFDYRLRYHAAVHQLEDKKMLSVVGAPESVLEISKKIWRNGKSYIMEAEDKKKLESVFSEMSESGLRVVALAKTIKPPEILKGEKIKDLVFVGFFGMKDALRPEVSEALQKAISAGIKVVMITGDHKITAKAIAREAGIYHEGEEILTGQDIDNFTEDELSKNIDNVSVFARVTPEHKIKIIRAYKLRGEIVAMTGDGVNDAPSLVAADLGVAMGVIGTEVAKEAADIVLLDDNFGSIVAAVEEGRNIYKTIKKVILYLFSTSAGEVLTIGGAMFLGYPLPVLPAQIIWLNFVTDGFLDVALAMEPKEEGLLKGNFERPKKYLIDKLMAQRMVFMAVPMMVGTLFLFKSYFETDIVKAWTVSLTVLAVFQWFNAWNCRHEKKSIFKMGFLKNKFLVGATVIIIFLQLMAIYNPFLQKVLQTAPLDVFDWLKIIAVAFSIIVVEEIRKIAAKRIYIMKTNKMNIQYGRNLLK